MIEHLSGFAPLADRYNGFILDLWGVIHDGVNAFPHSIETLMHLRHAGKRTLLLSECATPERGGAEDDAPDGNRGHPIYRRPHQRRGSAAGVGRSSRFIVGRIRCPNFFTLGPNRDKPVLEGLPFTVVDDPADFDFVLNTGPDDHRNPSDLAEFEPTLVECARHRLKMICANPDLEVIRGGVRVLCAGALAVRYAELGGDVRSLGKPDPAIYQPVLEQLGLPPDQVLAVGDSSAPTSPEPLALIWPPAGFSTASMARVSRRPMGASTPPWLKRPPTRLVSFQQ